MSYIGGFAFVETGLYGIHLFDEGISISEVMKCIDGLVNAGQLPHAEQCRNPVIDAPTFQDLI
jgi:hypothetical protein